MHDEEYPGWTRLGAAVLAGDTIGLVNALKAGDDPNEPALSSDWTLPPLGLALLHLHNEMVWWLLKFGAETNVLYEDVGGYGRMGLGHLERSTPLFLAEYTGNLAAVRLLKRMGAVPEFSENAGVGWSTFVLLGFRAVCHSPSWRAYRAMKGRVSINDLRVRLRRIQDLDEGHGFLIRCARRLGRADYIELLINEGADVNALKGPI
jgi:hypothetical protein